MKKSIILIFLIFILSSCYQEDNVSEGNSEDIPSSSLFINNESIITSNETQAQVVSDVESESFLEVNVSVDKNEPVYEEELSEDEKLRARLTNIQYEVTQNSATEKAYQNAYWDNYAEGIYVDIIDGTALFSSTTKFKSNTGWPSFSKPISARNIVEVEDNLLWFTRIELRGATSDSHLGHIFNDGPKDEGGLRYCVNSASLRFVAKADMQSQGYQNYLYLFE